MVILALIAAAASTPQPNPLKLFKDWTVGCDNGRTCQAVALMPETMDEGSATMSVRRTAEAGAVPRIRISLEAEGGRSLAADGKKLDVRLTDDHGVLQIASADVPQVIAALRSAARLQALDNSGKAVGTVSLAGASAALLYMDEQQKRIGTVTALARPGRAPAGSVPPAPAVPVVRAAPPSRARPIALGPARIKALRKAQGCEIDEVGGPDEIEVHPLDAQRSLVLLACGSGAYNVTTIPLIAQGRGAGARIVPAPFDLQESWWDNGPPRLINASWEGASSSLSSFSKARGLGDCGVAQNYVWDGSRFRLVEQSEMGECRGSTDYITTWRAEIARRSDIPDQGAKR